PHGYPGCRRRREQPQHPGLWRKGWTGMAPGRTQHVDIEMARPSTRNPARRMGLFVGRREGIYPYTLRSPRRIPGGVRQYLPRVYEGGTRLQARPEDQPGKI